MGVLGLNFQSLGALELLIIFIVVLILFGAKRIPEIARGLGKGIREFKSATSEISRELTVEHKQQRYYQPPAQQPIHTSQPQNPHPQSAVPPAGSTPVSTPPASTGTSGQP